MVFQKKNKAQIKSLTQELIRVDASAGKLESLNRDLSRAVSTFNLGSHNQEKFYKKKSRVLKPFIYFVFRYCEVLEIFLRKNMELGE
jgi:hypothetical protein